MGQIPVSPIPMTTDLSPGVRQASTVIGGRWNWDKNISGHTTGISISSFTCSLAQLVALDAKRMTAISVPAASNASKPPG